MFLLNWWGVKWLTVDSRFNRTEKFLESPQGFELLAVGEGGDLYGFKYKGSSPILSASNAPVALFIGSEEAYSLFFRALSLSNFNSKHLVPVYGGDVVDDVRLETLEEFDIVVIYGYRYRFGEEAYPLLREYVSRGGRLLMFTDLSMDASRLYLPEPAPIWRTEGMAFGTAWNFTTTPNEYTEGVNFSRFSPAVYGDGPWGYSGTYNSDLKEGATVILLNHGQPVVVERGLGEGMAVWCGLNLPLHAVSYENREESQFLVNLVSVGLPEAGDEPGWRAEMVNPERFRVEVETPARGVLFKECWFPNWRAHLTDRGTSLKIYKAGPNFMYVRLTEGSAPCTVEFRYTKSWVQWLGDLISLTSLCGLVIYVSPAGARLATSVRAMFSRLRQSI